jgi:hypothetical protein
MKAATRALSISNQFSPTQTRSLSTIMSAKQLDIHSTVRMKSGYEIPALGYGGSNYAPLVLVKSIASANSTLCASLVIEIT